MNPLDDIGKPYPLPSASLGGGRSSRGVSSSGSIASAHQRQTVPITEEEVDDAPPPYSASEHTTGTGLESGTFTPRPRVPPPSTGDWAGGSNDYEPPSPSGSSDAGSDLERGTRGLIADHAAREARTARAGSSSGGYRTGPPMSPTKAPTAVNHHCHQHGDNGQVRPGSHVGDDSGCCCSTGGGCCFSESGGCCCSRGGGCCFSEDGSCCFSRGGGCCFSDKGGCCFSRDGGCCFSDNGGCCCSDNGGCCFSDHSGCIFSDQSGCCFAYGPGNAFGNAR